MKSEKEIRARLKAIDADERYHSKTATIFENAPLALVQMGMESEALVLAWVLEIKPLKKRKKANAPASKETRYHE